MSTQGKLIGAREALLDRLSGSSRATMLNGQLVTAAASTDDNPAAVLHGLMLQILARHAETDGAGIAYTALGVDPLFEELRDYSAGLAHFDPSSLKDRSAKLAFWIQLYNALVIDAVIKLGVDRSVMEKRAGFWFFRKAAYLVGGQRMSCDDIEHGILRLNRGHPFVPGPQFAPLDARQAWVVEPFDLRIHFALNCASRSCPPIRAYAADGLDAQLEMATRSFLAAEVTRLQETNTLQVSSIFRWFAADFGGRQGILRLILEKHPDAQVRAWLSAAGNRVSLRYSPYDWRLNGKI